MTTPYLEQLLEPLRRCLTPEAAERKVNIQHDPRLQARLAELAGKCAAGTLAGKERVEYEAHLKTGSLLALVQIKAQTLLAVS